MILLVSVLLLTAEPNPAAVRLTRKATVEYNAGEFGQAFLDYQAAYDLEPIPELLFDMAQTQRGLHHWERASFLYKRYLTAKPQARNRAKAEDLLAQAEQKLAEANVAALPPLDVPPALLPSPATDVPPTAAPTIVIPPVNGTAQPVALAKTGPSPGVPLVSWIVGGVGAAGLVAAGVMGIVVLAQPDNATILSNGTRLHSLTYGQLTTINTEGTVSVALAVGGTVALGAAMIWWAITQ